jgi:hypothetical protein
MGAVKSEVRRLRSMNEGRNDSRVAGVEEEN